MNRIQILCVPVLALAASATIACGDSTNHISTVNPVGATAETVTSQLSTIETAPISVNVGGNPTTVSTWAAQRRWRAAVDGLTAEATDVFSAVTGSCPNLTITVRGTPVTVNATTVFGTGVTCAGLAVGQTVTVVALVTFGTGTFSVVATEIRAHEGGGGGHEAEVSGTVANVAGTCPAVTITLVGTGGVVVGNASTTFDPAESCRTIAVGTVIEAHGTRNSTGQLAATTIEVTTPESGHRNRFNGEGTISHLTGTCPVVSMVIREAHVATTASTTFEHGACSELRDGTRVAVTGDRQADGSIKATVVRVTDSPGHGEHFDGEGTIASVTGTCPVVTMTIEGHAVKTSAATTFTGGACADLRAGARIAARGTSQADTFTAESIIFLRSRERS